MASNRTLYSRAKSAEKKAAHDSANGGKALQFIRFMAAEVSEWPTGKAAAAYYVGNKMRTFHWREHYSGISPGCWRVCTRAQWQKARTEAKDGL